MILCSFFIIVRFLCAFRKVSRTEQVASDEPSSTKISSQFNGRSDYVKKDPHPSIDPGMGEIPVPEKRSYTMKEIQEILGVSKITALKLVQRNLFHTVRVGNRIRISKRSFGSVPGLNLNAPWDVPIAIARESTPVRLTNSSTSSGRV